MNRRSVRRAPVAVQAGFVLALGLHLLVALDRAPPAIDVQALPAAPPLAALQIVALGEPEVLARLAMLWLQAFDYQPGVSVPLAALDYTRVRGWLERMLDLDPDFHYPLLAAARVYAEVPDPARQRLMLDLVAQRFSERPVLRWQWLAHAVFVARHRLHDDALALELAQRLAALPPDADIPSWARQMHIFVLEGMGELDTAKVLLGGLLASGEIRDPHEQWFLSRRLADIEQRAAATHADGAAGVSADPIE